MGKLNLEILFRKKKFTVESVSQTNLSRVLGLLDVCTIGISATLGAGIYILAGAVIKNYTGPSVFLSFVFAGLATFLSGICYAELGSRVPRSGSAYVYIYVTIGEFVAFMMGWDLILEYIIGISSHSSALSQYIDYLFDRKIQAFMLSTFPLHLPGFGPYPDFLAFVITLVVLCLMIIGVKESSSLNRIFTLFNVAIISFIIVVGATKVNFSNWSLKVDSNTTWFDNKSGSNQTCASKEKCGEGGFMPFGFIGVINGAAKCFYAYIGFDAISTTGEEVLNPKKNIPLSIFITLLVSSVLYCSLSAVLTLMIPYYMTDSDISLPQAFQYVHLDWARYLVSVGAMCSLASCLYSQMLPLPRIVYSMACDGLIFKSLARLLPRFKTPYIASISTGLFAAVLACIFDLQELVEMMSVGTLIAYTMVSICVLILRYRNEDSDENVPNESLYKQIFFPTASNPTYISSRIVNWLTSMSFFCIVSLCLLISKFGLYQWYILVWVSALLLILTVSTFLIWRQPQITNISTFKIPLVPFIPLISVFFNVYMMTSLGAKTWYRFIIWFALGIVIYFMYGLRHSEEGLRVKNQNRVFPLVENDKIKSENEKI